jgi:phage terminase small subunit
VSGRLKAVPKDAARAPEHLEPATKAWWERVVAEWALDDHHVRLLTLAAESWDRCQAARQVLGDLGLSYVDRFGAPRTRPEVAIERDSRTAFARLLRALDLDAEPPLPAMALRRRRRS